MIFKNEIPILEFDTDETAVIIPTHENLNLKLPKKAVFAFLDEHIDKYAKAHNGLGLVNLHQKQKTILYMSSITKEKMFVFAKHQSELHLPFRYWNG